jgi:hypothetical protein
MLARPIGRVGLSAGVALSNDGGTLQFSAVSRRTFSIHLLPEMKPLSLAAVAARMKACGPLLRSAVAEACRIHFRCRRQEGQARDWCADAKMEQSCGC